MADLRGEATTPWRLWRRFSPRELDAQMMLWRTRPVTSPRDDHLEETNGWNRYYSEATVAQEAPGAVETDGAFAKARALVTSYEFSDPRIVRGHFDAKAPLLGRTMLLEISAYGLHYLCGVRVAQVRDLEQDVADGERTVFAFRYDTLEGHIEEGAEWFVLTKLHRTGAIQFRIQATWRPGTFPNWWSRVGFAWVGPRFQRAWHRLAYLRLRTLLSARGLPPLPRGRGLMHRGLPVDAPPVNVVGSASPRRDVREQEIEEVGR